jgi:hypothetical protein
MIVEKASVMIQLDLDGLNGSNCLVARPVTLQFSVAANSFFSILVFNDLLRAVEPGSMALIPQNVPPTATPTATPRPTPSPRARPTPGPRT